MNKPRNKSAETQQARREFVKRFSQETLVALATIVNGVRMATPERMRSLRTYKGNLTRGFYRPFVATNRQGEIVKDRLNLKNYGR
jgi:hypothetical protein